jgi:hypothetical protein
MKRPLEHGAVIAVSLGLCLAACSDMDRTAGHAVNRDSAGVRIVESEITGLPVWTLLEPAEVTIGVVEGDAPYQLDRVSAAFRLSDGRILVANGGTLELRYFDPTGRHIRTTGGRGSGPGEFRAYGPIRLHEGDSVLVFDNQNRRITMYDQSGERVSEWSTAEVSRSLRFLSLIGLSPDGRPVLRSPIEPETHTSGYVRDTLVLVIVGPEQTTIDTIGRIPGHEWVQRIDSEGGRVALGMPFSRTLVSLRWGDGLVTGTGEQYELRRIGFDGRLDMIVRRRDAPLIPVTRNMRNRWLDSARQAARRAGSSSTDTEFPTLQQQIDAVPTDRALRAYGDVRVSSSDQLWVEDAGAPPEPDSVATLWTVFNTDGRAMARARLPRSLTLRHIAADHIVGTVRDNFDVQYVMVYRIQRQ